jgi:hypothetical protein
MSELHRAALTSEVRTVPVVHKYVVMFFICYLIKTSCLVPTYNGNRLVQVVQITGTIGTIHRHAWYSLQVKVVCMSSTRAQLEAPLSALAATINTNSRLGW